MNWRDNAVIVLNSTTLVRLVRVFNLTLKAMLGILGEISCQDKIPLCPKTKLNNYKFGLKRFMRLKHLSLNSVVAPCIPLEGNFV